MVCVTVLTCIVGGRFAVAEAIRDYQVQAAMLYKFLAYVEWPATAFADQQTPYRIAVLSAGEIEKELRQITAGRTVNDRPIEIERVSRISQLSDPHLVFVGRRAEKYLPRLASLAHKKSFLIVTENEIGVKEGSAINLRLVDGRVGFDVSLPDAQKSNIRLSARLLSVASSVKQVEH